MRRLSLLVLLCTSFMSNVFAEIDSDTIKKIHEQLQHTFMAKCKYDLASATDATCMCLADKAQELLNDVALGHCSNDESGTGCITELVSGATKSALANENVAACSAQPNQKLPLSLPQEALPPMESTTSAPAIAQIDEEGSSMQFDESDMG